MPNKENKTRTKQTLKGQNEKTFFMHQYINISARLHISIRILCKNQEEFVFRNIYLI